MEILKALGWSFACFDMFLFGLVLLGPVSFIISFHHGRRLRKAGGGGAGNEKWFNGRKER